MWHDANAGRVLVDQDMVRSLVRAIREKVRRVVLIGVRNFEGEKSGDDGLHEPLWECFVEERVLDEFGWPDLETTMG